MTEKELLGRAKDLLAQLLERPIDARHGVNDEIDMVWTSGRHAFLVGARASPSLAHIEQGIRRLREAAKRHPDAVPLLVVPAMGPAGTRLAKDSLVSWLDASGKADITGPSLRILIEHGRREPSTPRKAGPFSPRASNLVHALLLNPMAERDASELANEAHLDNGYVTRILDALIGEGYVVERRLGRRRLVHVDEPNALLTAWDEQYKRPKPFAYALLATRDGFATETRVADTLRYVQIPYALTALAAAAEYTRFGSFRRITVYARREDLAHKKLDWEPTSESRGRNVAFLDGRISFDIGMRQISGRAYASPILTYIDLRAESERAEEARTEMKRHIQKSWHESN